MTPLPPKLAPLAVEMQAYFRELPHLLADGHAGRHVLVKDGAVVGVWDSADEAYQEGVSRFGFGPFLAQPIDPRDLDRLVPYFSTPAGGVRV